MYTELLYLLILTSRVDSRISKYVLLLMIKSRCTLSAKKQSHITNTVLLIHHHCQLYIITVVITYLLTITITRLLDNKLLVEICVTCFMLHNQESSDSLWYSQVSIQPRKYYEWLIEFYGSMLLTGRWTSINFWMCMGSWQRNCHSHGIGLI